MTESREPFERRLGATLESLRPVDGASGALRSRVAAVPAQSGAPMWLRWRRPLAGATLAVGALAVAVVVVRPVLVATVAPGSGNAPAATVPFDPSIDGLGILRGVIPMLWIVPPVLGLAIAAFGARWARGRGRVVSWRVVPGIVVGAAVAAIALQPGFVEGSFYSRGIGYGLEVDSPPGTSYPSTWYETAQPGGVLMIGLSFRNGGPLPIRLEGLVETVFDDRPLISRWTSLWVGSDPDTIGSDIAHLVPFTPRTVDPGKEVQVYLVGRAGLCVYGPGYAVGAPIQGHVSRGPTIEIAYSVFDLSASAPYTLPVNLVEPYRDNCEAVQPTVTQP